VNLKQPICSLTPVTQTGGFLPAGWDGGDKSPPSMVAAHARPVIGAGRSR
jgi:hypothetical protein